MITLSAEEVEALFEALDQLTGGSPENVFAWDGTDDPANPDVSVWVKVFKAMGRNVPKEIA